MKLSQADIHALNNLAGLARNAFRSKVVLQTLSGLSDRGLIDFDPMNTTATITKAGAKALREVQP